MAVGAVVGLLTGLRAIAHVELPRVRPLLEVAPIPREGIGVTWSARALWPADVQEAALEQLVGALAALALSAVLVAALNALILLAESAAHRRSELAVRSAVGGTAAVIARMLVAELRPLLTTGAALGLVAGLASGGMARALWPGRLLDVSPADPTDLLVALLVAAVVVSTVYVRSGLRSARPERAASVLRAGARTAADPVAIFARKALTAGHTALAGALLVGTVALYGALAPAGAHDGDEGAVVHSVTAPRPGAWVELLATLGEIPGMEAESLSTPGALIGLGIREVATAECGNCSRGLMPAPLWNALADHHAVSPGYLELAGLELVDGRFLDASDGPGAEPVIVVNETFARSSFERGRPVGKRVRIGEDLRSWYRVVGVVADRPVPVLGAEIDPKEVVYLSALQQPPRSGELMLRGSESALDRAEAALGALGFAPGPRRSLAEHRALAATPLRWAWRVAATIAALALLLAGHGVYATALQTTRRRTGEMAIRRALGARASDIVRYVLLERLRIVAWGLAGFAMLGTFAVGLLQKAAGLPAARPLAYLGIALALAALAMGASLRAAREASGVEPAALLD